ncbi:MAG: prolyl oligopeptidase family serine peptidase [Candidatus Nanopelagicales bacterium]
MTESFPLLQARTRRFTLGAPSDVSLSPDGTRVAFLQSTGPTDSVKQLLVADITRDFRPMIAADPGVLLTSDEELSPAERARRERLRESGAGIVSFNTDDAFTTAVFALSGSVGVASLTTGGRPTRLLDVARPAVDPRVDPTGQRIAWVCAGSLHVAALNGTDERCLLEATHPLQTWGLANFLAAEEFDRVRGFWWAPDGSALLVEEVDESDVDQWHIANPSDPGATPHTVRYPAVGRPNPRVRLWLVPIVGERMEVGWDHDRWEYLVSVRWNNFGPPLVTLFDRPQRHSIVLSIDPTDGSTSVVGGDEDVAWVSVLPGTPTWTVDGQLVSTHQSGDVETVAIDGVAVELPAQQQVTAVVRSSDDGLLLAVAPRATASSLVLVGRDGRVHPLAADEGWTVGDFRAGTLYTAHADVDARDWARQFSTWNPTDGGQSLIATLESHAMTPPIDISPELVSVGERALNTVVLWPQDHVPGSARLPVVMNPYGGPHAQRVIEVGRAFAEAQWIANQGFAVIVTDGRGSPGRGPAWERAISGDLGSMPLQDQVDALTGVAQRWPDDIDVDRVGITGWSFGGYLAALAVLRRPDVFHAAVAGAPVTEWRLYDSAYTERYLGDPESAAANYDASSLLPLAAGLERPLMIIHGFADDNVVVAHSLQLSSALTAAGCPHTFVPLANVTHMTPQEEVAENLLRLEVAFFQSHL